MDLDRRHFRLMDQAGHVALDYALPGSYAEDYVTEMSAFLAALKGEPVVCGGREALEVLEGVILTRSLAGLPS